MKSTESSFKEDGRTESTKNTGCSLLGRSKDKREQKLGASFKQDAQPLLVQLAIPTRRLKSKKRSKSNGKPPKSDLCQSKEKRRSKRRSACKQDSPSSVGQPAARKSLQMVNKISSLSLSRLKSNLGQSEEKFRSKQRVLGERESPSSDQSKLNKMSGLSVKPKLEGSSEAPQKQESTQRNKLFELDGLDEPENSKKLQALLKLITPTMLGALSRLKSDFKADAMVKLESSLVPNPLAKCGAMDPSSPLVYFYPASPPAKGPSVGQPKEALPLTKVDPQQTSRLKGPEAAFLEINDLLSVTHARGPFAELLIAPMSSGGPSITRCMEPDSSEDTNDRHESRPGHDIMAIGAVVKPAPTGIDLTGGMKMSLIYQNPTLMSAGSPNRNNVVNVTSTSVKSYIADKDCSAEVKSHEDDKMMNELDDKKG